MNENNQLYSMNWTGKKDERDRFELVVNTAPDEYEIWAGKTIYVINGRKGINSFAVSEPDKDGDFIYDPIRFKRFLEKRYPGRIPIVREKNKSLDDEVVDMMEGFERNRNDESGEHSPVGESDYKSDPLPIEELEDEEQKQTIVPRARRKNG